MFITNSTVSLNWNKCIQCRHEFLKNEKALRVSFSSIRTNNSAPSTSKCQVNWEDDKFEEFDHVKIVSFCLSCWKINAGNMIEFDE